MNRRVVIIFFSFFILFSLYIATDSLFKNKQELVAVYATEALEKIKKVTVNNLITDKVVEKFMFGIADNPTVRWGSWEAREEVFAKHQCWIFEKAGYEDVEKVCDTARYAEFNNTDNNIWYRNDEIPVKIAVTIGNMRKPLYEVGRKFLIDPKNLQLIYEEKKEIIIKTFLKMNAKQQENVLIFFSRMSLTSSQYIKNKNAKNDFLKLSKLEEISSNASEEESREKFSDWYEARNVFYKVYKKHFNLEIYEWLGRRFNEGGEELVIKYGKLSQIIYENFEKLKK